MGRALPRHVALLGRGSDAAFDRRKTCPPFQTAPERGRAAWVLTTLTTPRTPARESMSLLPRCDSRDVPPHEGIAAGGRPA
jgi:hypothetical protein